MSRSADYTIQGFLYQFNKTLLEILRAQNDDTITLEGIVEDVEVTSSDSLTAIQCKYHEAKTYSPSKVYEPLLRMLKHFSDYPTANVRYVLFVHFSGAGSSHPIIDESFLETALKSKSIGLEKLIETVPKTVDLKRFINRFEIELGPSYDEIAREVGEALKANGLKAEDIETLAYPNAIHLIAMLSIKHNASERRITKKDFVSELKAIRKTAISKWTLALKTREKLLQSRRKQLKIHFDKNARLRCFILDPESIEDYDDEIVLFISDYIDKYHCKPAHTETPILCIRAGEDQVRHLQRRLYAKDIVAEDGYIGGEFQESRFLREPLLRNGSGPKVKREFALRILNWDEHGDVLNRRKCDDLFIIGELKLDSLDIVDVNVERLSGATMKELKYIIGVGNVYE